MKNLQKLFLFICMLQILSLSEAYSATVDWKGTSGTDWGTGSNWSSGSVPASGDAVRIGVASFTSQPTLNSGTITTIASLVFGTTKAITLTVNSGSTLAVTGNITQNASNALLLGVGTLTNTLTGLGAITCASLNVGDNSTFLAVLANNKLSLISTVSSLHVSGNVAVNSTSFGILFVGVAYNNATFSLQDGTALIDGIISTANTKGGVLPSTIATPIFSVDLPPGSSLSPVLQLSNAAAINTSSIAGSIDFNNNTGGTGTSTVYYSGITNQEVYTNTTAALNASPSVYQNLVISGSLTKKSDGGNLTIGGDLTLTPTTTETLDLATNSPIVTISGNFVSNTGATLIQGGTGTMSITGTSNNAGTLNQTGSGNITFTGALNNSLTSAAIVQTGTGAIIASAGISNAGTISQGSGTIGSIAVTGSLTNTGTVTQTTGNISVSADLSNSGILTLGSANLTISGNYTNSGTYTQSTGTTLFNGTSAENLQGGGGAGTPFNNVSFSGAGAKTMTSGNLSVSSTAVLTMIGSSTLAANGFLTLISDVNGSATVAALPPGASITGNVNVQRFIQGSITSALKRGYRLISSAVYNNTVAGVNVFSVQYLLNNVLVSGLNGPGNGFNVTTPTNNPSLYLFREDDPPPPNNGSLFLTQYNWKGIANLNNANVYDVGIQKKSTTTNTADTTTNIPVGNGMLFFFRGNSTVSNGTTSGTKVTPPFNFPEDVATVQTGTLNTGTINVKLWFANAANKVADSLSYTAANVNSGTSSLRGGFNFVGNPYASTINWEKYNRNGANSSIYGGGGLPSTIWVYNEVNSQFESYIPLSSGTDTLSVNPGTATGSASNMIASGQGFFVVASSKGQTLSFRETAKTNTQPVAANLHKLMGKPKEFAATPQSLLRLKLLKDSINTDEIVIRLDKRANNKFLINEDARDMGGSGALVSLSALSSDSVALAISSIPFPGRQPQVVALSADATAPGSYQFNATQLANIPPLYNVWLKDALTNDSLNLKTTAAYKFTIDKNNPATFGSNRFTVIINQNPAYAYQLLNFTAKKAAATPWVQLVWKTLNEENYTGFTVERSTDGGKTFAIVGGLRGTGAGTYSLPDKKPVTGTNLYRLKQEDLNDSITYSKVIPVQFFDAISKLSVYPNPATSLINVSIADAAGIKPPYTIQITNTSGFVIRQVNSSQQNWQANVADLMPGTYIVKVHNSTDNTLIGDSKFVKL